MLDLLYNHFLLANQNISTDSRKISSGCIFFALKGGNFDGNIYAQKAIDNGAALAVIDNPKYEGKNMLLVENVLDSLQKLAHYHKRKSAFKVFALTGTNGKTTTKELINCVLSSHFKCFATQGNLNNHIGVPLTILSTPQNAEILIVEMGANHKGEIKALCNIADPDLGLVTNIGKAHIEGFGSFEGVIEAKSELYNYLKSHKRTIFYNSADNLLSELLSNYSNVIKYNGYDSVCFPTEIMFNQTLSIECSINQNKIKVKTNLFGEYNVPNIMAAISAGNYFGISKEEISEALIKYEPKNNRSQILKTENNTLILDSYNANPSSMEAALNSFEKINSQNKILILGEMKELGENSQKEHKHVVTYASKLGAKRLYFIGNGFTGLGIDKDVCFEDVEELIEKLSLQPIKGALILIKGSRSNKLEEIVNYL